VTGIMYQDCLIIDCVPVFHKIITPAYLLYPFWTGRCLLFRNLFLILWFRSYSDIIIVDIICFICGGGAKIIVAPLRPACRAAAAAIGRYLLPAPDLSSRPSSRYCCCCRLTGRTDTTYCADRVVITEITITSFIVTL